MSTGIEGIVLETHNWGKSVAFWLALGFELEFETDHHSGQLRHPGGGPHIFVAERPADHRLATQIVVGIDEPEGFSPPASGTVEREFTLQHWGVQEMILVDPDGRRLSLQTSAVAPPETSGGVAGP